jgi:hypothetical protein
MFELELIFIRGLGRSDVAGRSNSVPQRNDERRIPNMPRVSPSTFEDQVPSIFPRDALSRPEARDTFFAVWQRLLCRLSQVTDVFERCGWFVNGPT